MSWIKKGLQVVRYTYSYLYNIDRTSFTLLRNALSPKWSIPSLLMRNLIFITVLERIQSIKFPQWNKQSQIRFPYKRHFRCWHNYSIFFFQSTYSYFLRKSTLLWCTEGLLPVSVLSSTYALLHRHRPLPNTFLSKSVM